MNQGCRLRDDGIHRVVALILHIRSLAAERRNFFQCALKVAVIGNKRLLGIGQSLVEIHNRFDLVELVIGIHEDRIDRLFHRLRLLLVKCILVKALEGSPGLAQLHRIAGSGLVRDNGVLIGVCLIVRNFVLIQVIRAAACVADTAGDQVHMEIRLLIRSS